jgi:glycopeptide antibiotics resistance protein
MKNILYEGISGWVIEVCCCFVCLCKLLFDRGVRQSTSGRHMRRPVILQILFRSSRTLDFSSSKLWRAKLERLIVLIPFLVLA